jgi:hypothetical protein
MDRDLDQFLIGQLATKAAVADTVSRAKHSLKYDWS